jgi:hypothetical protein
MEAQEYIKIERTRYLPSKIVVLVLLLDWATVAIVAPVLSSCCARCFLLPRSLLPVPNYSAISDCQGL